MNLKNNPTLKITILSLALIVALIPFGTAFASDVISATLTVPEGEFTVGDVIPLTLTVIHPQGYRVLPVQFQDSAWGELEIQEVAPAQVSANPDGNETTTQTIYATMWAPGEYATPELPLQVADTAGELHEVSASSLDLNLVSVLVEGDTQLRDIKPQASLPLPAIWPWIVGGSLIALLVALAAGWFLRRKVVLADTPDNRLPHEVAFDELARIESLGLPSQQRYKEHYTLVSDVLRLYVDTVFKIPTIDRTTGEIRRSLRLVAAKKESMQLLIALLNEADLVKFAKVQPKVALAQDYIRQSRQFVDETRPIEVSIDIDNEHNTKGPNLHQYKSAPMETK